MSRIRNRGGGTGRPGLARGHAVLTHQQVADILYRGGVIPSPCRDLVRYHEKRAFAKIRREFPELARELERQGAARQSPVVTIY